MTKLHEVVESIQSGHLKSELPEIRVGDLVRIRGFYSRRK